MTCELVWSGGLAFGATSGRAAIVVDGDGNAGPSPMQLAAFALAGCMAADVVAILEKKRQPVSALRVSLTAERAAEPPRRFLSFTLHFRVTGAVEAHAVERSIALSREKYCSAWHSMREDITLVTSFDILP